MAPPPFVQTVLGPVAPAHVGFTLPHEHVYTRFDLPDWWAGAVGAASQTDDDDTLAGELDAFKELGGSCLVDVTPRGIGRNPEGLRRLSQRTGLHIVAGCGWYTQPYYEPEAHIDRRSIDSLADEIVREFVEGIDGTDVRPGIIGEIGVAKTWISAQEERVHRAVARAQAATGLAITTHGLLSRVGLDQLRLLDAAGADLGRVIVGHCDWYPVHAYCLDLMDTGATIEFDLWGYPSVRQRGLEERVFALLLELLHEGRESQILLSQDVDHVGCLKAFGGNGYTHIQHVLIPRLLDAGVPTATVETMTMHNPRRLLTISPTGPAEGARGGA